MCISCSGWEVRSDGAGIFLAEKWVDSVVSVKKHSKRVMILKMVLDNGLLNIHMVYALHSEKLEEKRFLELEIRSMERGICPIATLALHLTLTHTHTHTRDVIGHVTIGTADGRFQLVIH